MWHACHRREIRLRCLLDVLKERGSLEEQNIDWMVILQRV
jgi:hypothetical protein